MENLESRHRKEKKELQAHIQSLKKIAKNDKSKKKDLISEIAKLEHDQDIRHKQELQDFSQLQDHKPANEVQDHSDTDAIASLAEDLTKMRVSKAQKRRNKKSQQEKDRAAEIKLQEKENIYGPRNMETQAINAKLNTRQLCIYQIPSDGDCLYKAVAHQLVIAKECCLSVQELRMKTALHIQQNKDEFMPFMSNPNTCDLLTDEEFQLYCDNIKNTKVWGGQLEIRAMSNSLKCPIHVIQSSGPDCIEQGNEFDGPPLVITYHRHMYSLGEHYNSTQQINTSDE